MLDFADLAVLLDRYAGGDARSVLEEVIAELCVADGIQPPQENVVVLGRVRDFFWPAARLVVEADSYAWHRSPQA